MLEKAWTAALEDTKALQVEKRSLEYALAESQREAFALATQLERASEILETAQKDAAAAQATASTARGRSSLLEKAWTAALQEVQELKTALQL